MNKIISLPNPGFSQSKVHFLSALPNGPSHQSKLSSLAPDLLLTILSSLKLYETARLIGVCKSLYSFSSPRSAHFGGGLVRSWIATHPLECYRQLDQSPEDYAMAGRLRGLWGVSEKHRDPSCCHKIFSTDSAFAAILNNGSLITWEDPTYGGQAPELKGQSVLSVYSNPYAFAAVLNNGSLIAWGDSNAGGRTPDLKGQTIRAVYSNNNRAFTAILDD